VVVHSAAGTVRCWPRGAHPTGIQLQERLWSNFVEGLKLLDSVHVSLPLSAWLKEERGEKRHRGWATSREGLAPESFS